MPKTNLTGCPFCGNDEFYRKTYIAGRTEMRYRFDGEDTYNGHIHASLNYKESKTSYCCNCHKPIRNLKEVAATEEQQQASSTRTE